MCGFAGILEPKAPESADALAATVRRMADALRHRGPDDGAEWYDPAAGIALGFRRLSVVDLSPAGRQPMTSASGRYVIAFNGEVYNAPALRRELAALGLAPAFRGHSDTEVMLAAIEAWGLRDAIERFVGMFAFALWDRTRHELSLVRDRFGVKPLCYQSTRHGLIFASEFGALRSHPRFASELDHGAMALFVRLGYIPAPHSIYAGAKKVDPGTILTVSTSDPTRFRKVRYWFLRKLIEDGIANPLSLSDTELLDRVDRLLHESVGIRMEADVPLGVFLSGGIDSSLVAALMQRQSARPVRTFSIGFADGHVDESAHADRVARHLGTEHTAFRVTAEDALEVVEQLPDIYDEPFADSSQIPTFLVAKLARSEVTVALTGDGGDEVFAGYDRYRWIRRVAGTLGLIPAPLRIGFARAIRAADVRRLERWYQATAQWLPRELRLHNFAGKLEKIASLAEARTADTMYLSLMSHTGAPTAFIPGSTEPPTVFTEHPPWTMAGDVTHHAVFLDLAAYLPDDILVKVDRASMAVGLEAREPLLDHRLFELAVRIPLVQRMQGVQTKWPLRGVLHRYVPRELVDRPKMGFGVPLHEWLVGPLRPLATSLFGRAEDAAGHAWRRLLSGRSDGAGLVWNLFVLKMWLARHGVDSPSQAFPRSSIDATGAQVSA